MESPSFGDRLKLRRAAAGLSQRELARISGVKQPLIAAIESGSRQPTEAVRKSLETATQVRPSQLLHLVRDQVLQAIHNVGGQEVRVFGSVARNRDQPGSDIDLLVTFPPTADIITLLTLEDELSTLLTVPVDVVSAGGSGPTLTRALAEAVPL
ncbi:MAG TPA: Cro/Cl family transcriptional regulator [Propionibacteriaceae bacterium]|nr:Cro/Cl family transcriptional regulator [Propionibacteriaceae bacterium]